MNSVLSALASRGSTYCTRENITARGTSELKRKVRGVDKNEEPSWRDSVAEALYNSCKSYSDSLRQKRAQTSNTALNKQKQKYHYRSLSSNIIRSKTSTAARQVVSQAKRELQQLKRAKLSGKYDEEEIDAAIAHAKSMERIARKKVRHLEEEEMAKASGKGKIEEFIDSAKENREKEDVREEADAKETEEESSEENIEENIEEFEVDEYSDLAAEMKNMTADMLTELEQAIEEEMKGMGLEELSESLLAATGNMDEHDIKMMEISHRNKEMKEIVKADAEYLKAIFEYYDNMKSASPEPVAVDVAL